uniref:SAM-dependent MTase RsmB/NOP-type domain-containing protein n=1 Tax=Globisporangium ultimum (strain ATCC 200006 / CBS 805.95 / DAOM BR144) TaxID=431595 RepID=K3WX53_GLOUD
MSELYKEAAQLLEKLEKRQGGLKSLAYAEDVQHKRSSFALVCETLRYKPLLRQLLAAVPQFKFQKKLQGSTALLYVSLYDLLFGREKIQGGGHLKKELMKFQNAFKEALVRMKIKAKVSSNEGLLPEENRKRDLELPRYVRINTLTISPKETQQFIDEYKAERDADVRDLLVLPHGTELHENDLATKGKLVLQDKASCFPAYILHGEHTDADGQEGDVIDACAAPGNKTCHVAMLLHQQPEKYKDCKVFAFDRSPKRLELLKRRMKIVGADGIVEPCLQSFLEIDVDAEKYANVRSILLDPSCSGSGMTNRLDHLLDIASGHDEALENDVEEDVEGEMTARVQSLADFQLEALLKAFSFPQVQRITYSTCSIFQKENEEVVIAALNSEANKNDPRPFVLRPCLQTWPRRGMEIDGLSADQAKALVRANGLEDSTNGFFVAYFERASEPQNATKSASKSNKKKRKVGAQSAEDAKPAETAGEGDEADSDKDDSTAATTKKRKQLSGAQKENRKRRKREKRKQKGAAALAAASTQS